MKKSATTLNRAVLSPFEFEKAIAVADIRRTLNPHSNARKLFLKEVHFIDSTWNPYDVFLSSTPRILCRPSGEGKSTELNCLSYLFTDFNIGSKARKRRVSFSFNSSWANKPRELLFSFIKSRLGVNEGYSLPDVLKNTSSDFTFISFDNIEHLHPDALTWLIGSIHGIEEAGLMSELRAHIAVSGSLGLGQTSRDITSMYYTGEQLYRIRDLDSDDMRRIAKIIHEMLGANLAPDSSSYLLAITSGDKRSTHLLLHLAFQGIQTNLEPNEQLTLQKGEIERALEEYLAFYVRRDIRMQRTMNSIVKFHESQAAVRSLLSKDWVYWDSIPPASRKLLYNEAIVTVNGDKATIRNLLVKRALADAFGRTRKSTYFLRSYLGRGTILGKRLRRQRSKLVKRLRSLSFTDNVLWIYYGEVIEETNGELRVFLINEDDQEFEATIMSTDLGIKLAPLTGFLRFGIWSKNGPKEEYYLYDPDVTQ